MDSSLGSFAVLTEVSSVGGSLLLGNGGVDSQVEDGISVGFVVDVDGVVDLGSVGSVDSPVDGRTVGSSVASEVGLFPAFFFFLFFFFFDFSSRL